MTKQESKTAKIESRVSNLETKFEMFMRSFEDFKTELRDRDNQRAAEIREIRQDMKDMQKNFSDRFAAMDAKIDGMGKHVRNLSVATIIGVATIAITVIYSIVTR